AVRRAELRGRSRRSQRRRRGDRGRRGAGRGQERGPGIIAMEITAQQVKALREATGAGVLDCRKALQSHDGDLEKAAAYLREKGLAAASKKEGREAKEGIVELYSHGGGRVGVMVEVNC